MEVDLIRHYKFNERLAAKAADGAVTIYLRVDGGLYESNIVIEGSTGRVEWRVGPRGGRYRSDNWNMVTMISQVTSEGDFPPSIQRVYEYALNQVRRGWVALHVRNGLAIRAVYMATIGG